MQLHAEHAFQAKGAGSLTNAASGVRLRNRQGGFTAVELIVVIAIVGILSVLAVPVANRMIANSKLNSAATSMRSALTLARSKAMANPAVHCGVCIDSAGGWMLLYYDDNGNNLYDSSGTPDRRYQNKQFFPAGTRVNSRSGAFTQGVVFRGDGSAWLPDTIRARSIKSGRTRIIIVTKESGEARITQ